ncbi:MAG: substrate-binding domain-containing protein, partial [Smithella sp.]|nr:substrate-binding domain-containing protein [Smithella sp.]
MLSIFKKTVLAVVALAMMSGMSFASSSVVIKGSTTVLPIVQAAVEAHMKANPGVHMSVSGGGSGEGIKAIVDK